MISDGFELRMMRKRGKGLGRGRDGRKRRTEETDGRKEGTGGRLATEHTEGTERRKGRRERKRKKKDLYTDEHGRDGRQGKESEGEKTFWFRV